jgi:signal transduction histidine kinase
MRFPSLLTSLSSRLLVLTLLFVLLTEILIFLPSAAQFRRDWLNQHLAAGHLAALSVEAAPAGMVTEGLERELLRHVGALSIDVTTADRRMLMLMAETIPPVTDRIDLMEMRPLTLIADALRVLMDGPAGIVSVTGMSPQDPAVTVTVVLDQAPLRTALRDWCIRIAGLALIISVISAGLVYLAVLLLTVRPMQRLVRAMMLFKTDPEGADTAPLLRTGRRDEVGIALRELLAMQQAVRRALHQHERLATLGTAMAKVNHDIRGILASATLLSERLLDSGEPAVRRTGPRILAALERAARLCGQTLDYTRDGLVPDRVQTLPLHDLVSQAVTLVQDEWPQQGPGGRSGDGGDPALSVSLVIPDGLSVQGDADQLLRALCNLLRNAAEAGAREVTVTAVSSQDSRPVDLEAIAALTDGEDFAGLGAALGSGLGLVTLQLCDDGPGLAPRAEEHLFRPFAGSTRPNGTGLGLAITREILRSHGGDIQLLSSTAAGTCFQLTLRGRAISHSIPKDNAVFDSRSFPS